jgi:UDP-glucuronate 4-epimerase
MTRVLVTGAAGFIGFHVASRLLDDGCEVVGIDNLNAYYDPALKRARLARLTDRPGFRFERLDVADGPAMARLFAEGRFDRVVHLAAAAGVRHSMAHPEDYVGSNLNGFFHVLEGCRHTGVGHLVYASSSSVYGANERYPSAVAHGTAHPLSFYAATKLANEAMAHSYAHVWGVPCTGLRFFTVYGPWGRPDMALFLFTEAILAGRPIPVFNHGDMERDFTYIDDIVEGVVRLLERPATGDPSWDPAAPDPGTSRAPWRLYNIGNNGPVPLMTMIETLEDVLGRRAERELLPMPAGDVRCSFADVTPLVRDAGYRPATPLRVGIEAFVAWYLDYYGVAREP